ncbi:MAG: cysteine-rich CWC family protein [Trinickia sp.]|uniref:cysteine-rich CWC family protein n=1 Tax=Trinickia sp. TaxID=2571163 RepID=UPI003F81D24E
MAVSDRSPSSLAPSARCPRCGCAFDCGARLRPFDCWCARMPALPSVSAPAGAPRKAAGGCLCPACYVEALAAAGDSPGHQGAPGSPGPDDRRENSTD